MAHVILFHIFGAFLLGLVSSQSYESYKVYEVDPQNEANLQFLNALHDLDGEGYRFWGSSPSVVGSSMKIMVSPEHQSNFEVNLDLLNVPYEILIENVERTIQAEREYHASLEEPSGRISFDRYYTHAQINQYLDELSKNYSNIVSVKTIGQSYEKRDIKAIRISSRNRRAKSVILIDAGMHAREWIAPATALYIIHQLVQNQSNAHYLDGVDWVVIPSLNPDGYDYTWTKDRFWRKTRSPGADSCFGVDPNRNFAYHWGESGSSQRSCADNYAGPSAFSEIEMQHFRDFVLNLTNVKLYITLHSYGRYLLYPYGYSRTARAPNAIELDLLGHALAKAITAVNGTKYLVGNSAVALYPAAGASDDWVMAAANVSLVYTLELPGGGKQGFDLPASGINSVVTETFEAFKVLHDYVNPKFN